jgi:hypothetical protein
MTRSLPVDPLKVSDYRQGIENRLAAFDTTHFQPSVPGFLLPTDQITGFELNYFGVSTTSTSFVPVFQGRIEQMVRPAIVVGFPAGNMLCYAAHATPMPPMTPPPTGQFRLRLQNAAGADVGNSPTASQSLAFVYSSYGFYWNHGVQLWRNEVYTLSVEARVTSPTAGDQVIICQPINGFEQIGLTFPGRNLSEKYSVSFSYGMSSSAKIRATTDGAGAF